MRRLVAATLRRHPSLLSCGSGLSRVVRVPAIRVGNPRHLMNQNQNDTAHGNLSTHRGFPICHSIATTSRVRYNPARLPLMSESLLSKLNDSGLAAVASRLVDLSRESFRLRSSPIEDHLLPVGVSKLGGCPDVPLALAWPTWKTGPLAFVAQINLSEVPKNNLLPNKGVLSFFYDMEQSAWGFDPNHREGFRTWYFPDTSVLVRRSDPLRPVSHGMLRRLQAVVSSKPARASAFNSCRLSFDSFLSLPESASASVADLLLELEDEEIYSNFLEAYIGPAPQHQLLGLPHPVQGEMELECQLVTNGLYTGDPTGYKDPRRKTLEPGAADWTLLLQVDSDDNAGMMWGDLGMLYFWIRRQDLATSSFDRVWAILQCH
jgi:uncharacterized protein YwqG